MKTILVPIDFSKCSLSAINYAIQYAEETGSKLVFFHSTFIFIPTSTSVSVYFDSVNSDKIDKMKKLETFIENAYKSQSIKRNEARTKLVVRFGVSPVDNILEMIHEQFIDMVIMGTHGASGLKKIFGNNTTKIIEQAICPVLAIPTRFKFKGIKKILYAASNIHTLQKELKQIIPFAEQFNSVVDVVHLIENKSKIKVANLDADTILNKLISSLKYPGMRLYIIDTGSGSIMAGLEKSVKNRTPDIIIMRTRQQGLFDKLFNRSKTKEMAFHLETPLLTVK